jgi:hypothetical protein
MKKTVYFGILAVIFCLYAPPSPTAAAAEDTIDYGLQVRKPEPSTPDYIYMIFCKLTGRTPDFEAMARNTQDYQDAATIERPTVLDQLTVGLKSTYSLLTLQEPFIIEVPVKLSPYSAVNKGFFVENFKDDTFFPVNYNGQSYAIIPQGIMDKQWLKVPDDALGKEIENAALNKDGSPLTMQLMLTPKYADSSRPVVLAEQNYWPIAVEIKRMVLYPPASTSQLWQSDDTRVDDTKRLELLNLRK